MTAIMRSLCLAGALWGWAALLWAQPAITEYPVPTTGSLPDGITSGPDGALWFAEFGADKIGRIGTTGSVTEFPLASGSRPLKITSGPDGALWFTEYSANKIGRITTAGSLTEYLLPTGSSQPVGIAVGPDNALWFTELNGNKIGRIPTAGAITEYGVPSAFAFPYGIAAGPDGALWFTEYSANKIGRITLAGVVTEYPLPAGGSPFGIVQGPDSALWFCELAGNKIGRITTSGALTEYALSTPSAFPTWIASGPDGALWFTENGGVGKIGRITTSGIITVTDYAVPTSSSGPTGITAGPDGALWFTESATARIGRAVPQGGGSSGGLLFVPVTPCRVADTRSGSGPLGAPSLARGEVRSLPILLSSCGLPFSAQAYSLNITVVPAGPLTYLSTWPTGQAQPVVSTLNSFDGRVVANAAIVPAGTNGAVNVYASDPTDVIVDVNGYFFTPQSGGLAFYPVTPCRVADTRAGSGPLGPPSLFAGVPRNFQITLSSCGIPASAQAYSLNLTVVPPGPLTYLSTWPTGQPQPVVSTLNSYEGRVVANAAIVPAGIGGSISVYATNTTDLIIDINGYFALPGSPGALSFHTATPCRVADTRGFGFTGIFGPPALVNGSTRDFPIPLSACGIPSFAQVYSLNVTVVPPGPLNYLTTWQSGLPRPVVSTLNSYDGKVVANAAIVPAGTNGAISVFVTDPTNVILDINGYFSP